MKKLLLLPIFLVTLFSCNSDDPLATGPNQTIVGFSSDTYTQNFSTELETATLKVPINLIGYANEEYPSDVVVTYAIKDESTAVDGVEYTAPAVLTGTLESGSSADYIEIPVMPDTFDPENPKVLVLELLSVTSGNSIIGANNKEVVVTLQGVCPSALQGLYATSTTRLSNGVVYTFNPEKLAKTDIFGTEYTSEYVGPYYCPGQAPGSPNTVNVGAGSFAGYKFNEVCGKIRVSSQNLANTFSNLVIQSEDQYNNSTVDPDTGIITVYYTITFAAGNRNFRSVYTPL